MMRGTFAVIITQRGAVSNVETAPFLFGYAIDRSAFQSVSSKSIYFFAAVLKSRHKLDVRGNTLAVKFAVVAARLNALAILFKVS